MKKFSDPLEVKNPKPKYEPMDGKNSPWDYRTPPYDQRHSCFVKAGMDYGKGITQPIGNFGNPKMEVPALPVNTVGTMRLDEKSKAY